MIEVKEGANPPATNLEHDLRSLLSRFKYVHGLGESWVAMFQICACWRLAVKTDPSARRLDKLEQTASASWA